VVTSLDGVDEKGGKLYFTGTKDDVLAPQVYALNYAHGGEPQRLTELGFANGASIDRSAQMLLVTRSGPAQPPQVYLADTTGKRLTWVEENRVAGDHTRPILPRIVRPPSAPSRLLTAPICITR
jgi:dipeptidyl-peptidase-4